MKKFRTFIVEDGVEFRARQRERQALKDKGYNIGTPNDPISNYVKDVAGGIAADPLEFAKQYGKSLVTDPETYHSGLAAAGMVPGIGEIADVADAALYKAQGDDEMSKLSLASGIPVAGAIGNFARVGRSAKLMEPMLRAERAVDDEITAWRETKQNEFFDTVSDPFFSQKFQIEVPATDDYRRLANNFGFLVPDVAKPTASLTPMEILQGVYGKDAKKNAELARRAQSKYGKIDSKFNFGNPSGFVIPDYSDSSLAKKFDIYVGTHMPENIAGTISPIIPNAEAVTSMFNPRSYTFNVAQSAGPANFVKNMRIPFKDMSVHELTHALGQDNPATNWPRLRDAYVGSADEYKKLYGDLTKEHGGGIGSIFKKIHQNPSFRTMMPEHPNNEKIAQYFTNYEIPGQIAQAKSWMQGKGFPNVNINMSAEEAKVIRDTIMDKYLKGMFPEFKGDRTMPSIIDILGNPEGKKLFDLIAKKEKGSAVNNKVQQMYA